MGGPISMFSKRLPYLTLETFIGSAINGTALPKQVKRSNTSTKTCSYYVAFIIIYLSMAAIRY
jgi:hypothetical protein